MKLGYARVSTDEQSLSVQLEQLRESGCSVIFTEKVSGKNAERPRLKHLLDVIETPCPECHGKLLVCETCHGQTPVLVVTKLDRLARNTRDLLEIVDRIGKAGAGLISLGEPWADTTSYAGRMVMTVLAGVAEFERSRILERTSEGRTLAKRNGVRFGRPCSLSQEQQREAIRMLKDRSVGAVARVFKVSAKTIRRLTAPAGRSLVSLTIPERLS